MRERVSPVIFEKRKLFLTELIDIMPPLLQNPRV
jgi:hypothetical protein